MASMTTGAAPFRTRLHRTYLQLAIYATAFTLLGACGGTNTIPTNGPGECGSGKVEGDEACDGADLAGKSCQSLGLPEGKLSCRADCGAYDTSACGAPATCGNGALDAGELCDGAELGGKNCLSLGSPGGKLACKNSCLGYDTSGCESLATCGNGALDDAEACDGDMFGGKSCQSEGFAGGSLSCAPTCLELDTTGCTGVCTPECSGRVCGADPVCGKSCGTCSGAHEACGADGQCQVTCDLEPIDANRTLDINLETTTLGGTVTLDGAALPGGGRPYLRFQNKSLGDVYTVDLPTSGAAAYTAKLWKGAYGISVRDRQSSVIGIGSGLGALLEPSVDLAGSATKNINLETATVGGTVTLDGAALPGGARPYLRFQNKSLGDTYAVALPTSGAAAYTAKLWKGLYDISVRDRQSSVIGIGSGLGATLESNVDLVGNATKNINFETVTVSGTVTLDGAALPGGSRPYLRFQNKSLGDVYIVDLPTSGAAAYTAKLWKGAYDVSVRDRQSSVIGIGSGLGAMLDSSVNLAGNATKNINLETVTINGTVTLDGAALPGGSRPYLRFRNKSLGDVYIVDLPTSGAAAYTAKLWKGAYDISVRDRQSSVIGIGSGLGVMLESSVDLAGNATKNINLETVTINGTVTLDGAALPGGGRPYLRFRNKSLGDIYIVDLPTSGAAAYTAKLWKGVYDISVRDRQSSVIGIGSGLGATLESNVDLVGNTTKNINLETATVNGTVILDGAALPDGGRPYLRFQNKSLGDTYVVNLPTSGAAAYTAKLWKGAYDVSVRDRQSSVIGIGSGLGTKLLRGCYDVPGGDSCADWNGTWRFDVADSSGIDDVDLIMKAVGNVLSGTWYSTSGYSGTFTGTRTGDDYKIEFDFSGCQWLIEGSTSGCSLVATVDLSCNSVRAATGVILP